MDVRLTGRHVELTDQVRAYVQEKAGKLPRYYDRIHAIDVVLNHESEQIRAEMIVHADRKQTFVVHGTGADTFAVVDELIVKMERQLTKHKEKSRLHKHDAGLDGTMQA